MDPVRELKVRAEILHHALKANHPEAIARTRVLTELRRVDDDSLRAAVAALQRKHCLTVVAREVGFSSWDHARRVFDGDSSEPDMGTLLYGDGGSAQLNHWFASYDEARGVQRELSRSDARMFLLSYKRQFFVVEREFIEALGLDPHDDDWALIDWDWARPARPLARRRLYAKLLVARRGEHP